MSQTDPNGSKQLRTLDENSLKNKSVTPSLHRGTVLQQQLKPQEIIMQFKRQSRLFGALALTSGLLSGGVVLASSAGAQTDAGSDVHALFLETDGLNGNSILSYLRGSDGTISFAGTYKTGGIGAAGANSSAAPLGSQDGLVLANVDHQLLAVNAGSDTVSVFNVKGTSLTLIQKVASGGEFPNSIAVHGNLVTVLNAGGVGAIQEFSLTKGKLVALSGENRSLGLSNTTPPDFVHGAGQVSYTPNGQHLIVTTKDSTNSFEVFSVNPEGSIGSTPTVTASDNPVPYDFNFDAAGHVFAIEAGNSSASVYNVNVDGSLTSLGTVSDGAKALCWVSSVAGYFYGSNTGSATVTSFDESSAGVPQVVSTSAATTHTGTSDSAVSPDGKFLYVESGGAGTIDVFAVGASGALNPVTTVFNVPTASEGIAVS
jgi:6-phosphogluconolactonase (cycloisomerase 2 family)